MQSCARLSTLCCCCCSRQCLLLLLQYFISITRLLDSEPNITFISNFGINNLYRFLLCWRENPRVPSFVISPAMQYCILCPQDPFPSLDDHDTFSGNRCCCNPLSEHLPLEYLSPATLQSGGRSRISCWCQETRTQKGERCEDEIAVEDSDQVVVCCENVGFGGRS